MSKRGIKNNENNKSKIVPNCAGSERHVERCATLTWRLDVSRPDETTRSPESEMPPGLLPWKMRMVLITKRKVTHNEGTNTSWAWPPLVSERVAPAYIGFIAPMTHVRNLSRPNGLLEAVTDNCTSCRPNPAAECNALITRERSGS